MALNWGGGGAGSASGALAGSSFGPIGAGIGGILGGVGGLFSGSKDRIKNISNLLPQQQSSLLDLLAQLKSSESQEGSYGSAQGYLSNMLSGSPEAYDRFAQPYLNQFQEKILPMLAERFSGLGGGLGGGALGSSGFGQAIGGAGSQLQSNLASLYAQLQQHAAEQAFGQHNTLAQLGLGTQAFRPHYQQGDVGFGGELASSVLGGAGKYLGQRAAEKGSSSLSDLFNSWRQTPGAPGYQSKQTVPGLVSTRRIT